MNQTNEVQEILEKIYKKILKHISKRCQVDETLQEAVKQEDIKEIAWDSAVDFYYKDNRYDYLRVYTDRICDNIIKKHTKEIRLEDKYVYKPDYLDDFVDQQILKDNINKFLDCFNDRDKYIIKEKYIKNRTLVDIAKDLGVSANYVSNLLCILKREIRYNPYYRTLISHYIEF